jgi:hypothetical protein
MKTFALRFLAPAALMLSLCLPWAVRGQSADNIPVIQFRTVPITMAIENLAHLAGVNYLVDPKLFLAADGTRQPEPSLTIHWENLTAASALARVLKENHLFAVTNDFTRVVFISGKPTVTRTVDAKLLGGDTNGVISTIKFMDVPLGEALKSMINNAHMSVQLDPHVTGEAPPEPPDFKLELSPTVSVSWHDLTARQALVELCNDYGLTIVKGAAPDTLEIKPRK